MTTDEYKKAILKISTLKPYFSFFEKNDFVLNHLAYVYYMGKTQSALQFTPDPVVVFDIKDPAFAIKRAEQSKGQGQKDLHNFKSSSMSPLLCFYAISDSNPLTYSIDGITFRFTDVHFEVRNKCVGRGKSNMDVVLYGTDSRNSKVIFFVETKFAEYYTLASANDISTTYTGVYQGKYANVLKECGLNLVVYNKLQKSKVTKVTQRLKLESNDGNPHYCEGIKQMICHHIAINRVIKKDTFKDILDQARDSFKLDTIDELDSVNIYLGEVLFKFDDTMSVVKKGKKSINVFTDYCQMYQSLLKGLPPSNIKMMPRVITYQELFKDSTCIQNANIKSFYKL